MGQPEPLNLLASKYYLKRQYEDAERHSFDGKVHTIVVFRGHKSADYAQVYRLLQLCKQQGYRRLNLRAMTKG
jgi:hypothetical protein